MIINEWVAQGLSCWSKIPLGLPTINEIQVKDHPDSMASTHSNFFQRQTDRGLFYWPNQSRETTRRDLLH